MDSKVFVTQIPNRRDRDTGAMVPAFNIAPAAEYGEVVTMMAAHAPFVSTSSLIDQLHDHLKHYDYRRGDSLVALGDPTIIAAAAAVLGKLSGRFRLLKWDRSVGRYLPTIIDVTNER